MLQSTLLWKAEKWDKYYRIKSGKKRNKNEEHDGKGIEKDKLRGGNQAEEKW